MSIVLAVQSPTPKLSPPTVTIEAPPPIARLAKFAEERTGESYVYPGKSLVPTTAATVSKVRFSSFTLAIAVYADRLVVLDQAAVILVAKDIVEVPDTSKPPKLRPEMVTLFKLVGFQFTGTS
jgi:uncharacterized protein (DUF1778 family)